MYTQTSSVPDGYAPPTNLLTATCSQNAVTITAGSNDAYTYKMGFVSDSGGWERIDFVGTNAQGNDRWIKGNATASVTPQIGDNYVIAFICLYKNAKWHCGCTDSACAKNH